MRLQMAKLEAPVMLVILDGFGLGDKSDTTNAVVQAKPLCFNRLWDMYPHTTLAVSYTHLTSLWFSSKLWRVFRIITTR